MERVFFAPRVARTSLLCILTKYSYIFDLAATTRNKQLCTLREHRLKSHQRPLVNKLPRNVKTPPMITHCNESSMIDRQSNKELKPICEKILCFLQGLLRRGGPQVPHHLARRNARKRLNPPTTACGATSVFETPSVLRESLPSYSAKPGAFYAPRALRWTTPPRGRTDPFQGPKIKPMFHRCSMLFQDDLGDEKGQKDVKI